ncbi:DUF4386 domain-containing protein [Shewanella sp. FJAT-51649]|uniref:DUF4386 domain-containing protein n=1 Tax=Shewanella sp. FJAT-51649 TaxID=2864210 RepID=UPI001C6620D3|nr:DUF4386 domain-containing protein [Shewanella sp. FJAT-51649]QYJ73315.1 DUF4386 domain-containing protein [Shewanella sp. FJAT-51649]
MDTLEKLAGKNKAQEKHRRNEHFLTTVMLLVLFPFFFGIAIDVGMIASSVNFNLWLYGLGALCFGLPLAAMGNLMLFSRWLKLLGLIAAQGWFVYFWAFQMQSWLAFVPLAPVFIWLQIQMPRIKQQANREQNGI